MNRLVHIRYPVFGIGPDYVDYQNRFMEWYSDSVAELTSRFDARFRPRPLGPGGREEAPSSPGAPGVAVRIQYPEGSTARVEKGWAVRAALVTVLAKCDSAGYANRANEYFVMIDGTGAFDLKCIELILEKLIEEGASVVLGRRPAASADWFMGDPRRKQVELFENHLLERRYSERVDELFGGSLPDAQAGCWGIRLDAMTQLALSAYDYCLEFDLAASSLASSLSMAFSEELVPGRRGPSSFGGFGSSIKKLDFILEKLGYSKQELGVMLDAYVAAGRKQEVEIIPEEYASLVREYAGSTGGAGEG